MINKLNEETSEVIEAITSGERKAIKEELDGITIRQGSELGVDPDAREALAFAVLAWGYLNGLETNVPAATGSAEGRILGSMTPGVSW